MFTICDLSSLKREKKEIHGELAVYVDNFLIRILWLTSSVFLFFFTSRKTAPTTSELLTVVSQLLNSLANTVWHECLGRKPDCDWLNRSHSFRNFSKCLCTCLLTGFESCGRIHIGRKLFSSHKSLISWRGVTLALIFFFFFKERRWAVVWTIWMFH